MELLTRQFFNYVFPEEKRHYNFRPEWLTYDGKKLELDIFYPSRFLAIEVDGPVHKWGEEIKKRDKFKDERCALKSIVLLRVSDPKMLLSMETFNFLKTELLFKERDLFERFGNVPNELREKLIKYRPQKIKWLRKRVEMQDTVIRYNKAQALERGYH